MAHNKSKNTFLIIILGVLSCIGIIVGAVVYQKNIPNTAKSAAAGYIKQIPHPSYMTADFSELENGCLIKCHVDTGEVIYKYSESYDYTVAWNDFHEALVGVGFSQIKSDVYASSEGFGGTSNYTFKYVEKGNQCPYLLVSQYHSLGRISVLCRPAIE